MPLRVHLCRANRRRAPGSLYGVVSAPLCGKTFERLVNLTGVQHDIAAIRPVRPCQLVDSRWPCGLERCGILSSEAMTNRIRSASERVNSWFE